MTKLGLPSLMLYKLLHPFLWCRLNPAAMFAAIVWADNQYVLGFVEMPDAFPVNEARPIFMGLLIAVPLGITLGAWQNMALYSHEKTIGTLIAHSLLGRDAYFEFKHIHFVVPVVALIMVLIVAELVLLSLSPGIAYGVSILTFPVFLLTISRAWHTIYAHIEAEVAG